MNDGCHKAKILVTTKRETSYRVEVDDLQVGSIVVYDVFPRPPSTMRTTTSASEIKSTK
jgi:hypothetical protein